MQEQSSTCCAARLIIRPFGSIGTSVCIMSPQTLDWSHRDRAGPRSASRMRPCRSSKGDSLHHQPTPYRLRAAARVAPSSSFMLATQDQCSAHWLACVDLILLEVLICRSHIKFCRILSGEYNIPTRSVANCELDTPWFF